MSGSNEEDEIPDPSLTSWAHDPDKQPAYALASPLGGIVTIGGVIGFVNNGSLPAMLAGVGLGTGLLASGYCIENPQSTGIQPKLSHGAACGLSWVVMSAMIPRAMRRQRTGMVMTIFSTLTTTYHAKLTLDWIRFEEQKKHIETCEMVTSEAD